MKETLNARSHYGSSEDDGGVSVHKINQYIIKQEIGRGSFGAVHLATDQYGDEFAIKEFSKSRLRKRAQSNLLRNPNAHRKPGHLAAGVGFNSPLHRLSSSDKVAQRQGSGETSLDLIKEEIAIMKKLNHDNLVNLIEVLDDPQEDSLYMVLEMCKKGVVMKVGLDERAEPYDSETCRTWFRDMILGIEYLHAQGIIHRDIKPDNCLVTNADVLKIVDFGVSEMFEKASEMATTKSAGSPAFMPPELCVARHGQVSGRAADIWSMGVTLYCLRYGRIPFEKTGVIEVYDSIREDDLVLENEQDERFADLMRRLLEKVPESRITMEEIRTHPWVTNDGADPMMSTEENCAELVEPPTQIEMNHAITGNMGHLLIVMKAVKQFKTLMSQKRGEIMDGWFGRENSKIVAPPDAMRGTPQTHDGVTHDDAVKHLGHDLEEFTVSSPIAIDISGRGHGLAGPRALSSESTSPHPPSGEASTHLHHTRTHTLDPDDHAKGHAHDPLLDSHYLSIGAGASRPPSQYGDDPPIIVSESPPAVDMNIYEIAYQEEMNRVLQERGKEKPSMYLNRRVEHIEDLRQHSSILDSGKEAARGAAVKMAGLADTLSRHASAGGEGLAEIVRKAREKRSGGEGESAKESSSEGEAQRLQTPTGDGANDKKSGESPPGSTKLSATEEDDVPANASEPDARRGPGVAPETSKLAQRLGGLQALPSVLSANLKKFSR